MGTYVKHEPCPNCGSKDNLARYDDGGAYCWGCGMVEKPTAQRKAQAVHTEITTGEVNTVKRFHDLPKDVSALFGVEAKNWLKTYPIDYGYLIRNHVVWSEERKQLIFKFVIKGQLEAWQARNFGQSSKSKNFTSGQVDNLFPIYGNYTDDRVLVVVEDPLSAINVSQVLPCTPLLGSSVSNKKLTRFTERFDKLIFWLDSDKFKVSQEMAMRAEMLGCTADSLFTDMDPKYYNKQEMQEKLGFV